MGKINLDRLFDKTPLLYAVACVFDLYEETRKESGAEYWCQTEAGRREMYDDVIREWRHVCDTDTRIVPWSVDLLAHLWTSYRKSKVTRVEWKNAFSSSDPESACDESCSSASLF